MNFPKLLLFVLTIISSILFQTNLSSTREDSKTIYLRANQIGYLPEETKIAIAFSHRPIENLKFEIIDAVTSQKIWGPERVGKNAGAYGNFAYHYRLDFSPFHQTGRYKLRIVNTQYESLPFNVGPEAYDNHHEILLQYMRQQRCGYNPFLDEVCHKKDGRTMYGPMPDSTYIDASGGWHDAGDYLRYLLTSGNAVCRLLFSYRENKGKFKDNCDALGHPHPNGIPDILDEAKWGLDWMLKMHPAPNQLFHQVADDRDHVGWDLPYQDTSDYGWGPGSYRVVYYATGKPQGLGEYKNTSTGIANLAGRYAAAMAMATDIWKNDLHDSAFAAQCLRAGKEVYEMGKKQPGACEGVPCRAPYRYYENTWADDMEWGAAEMFKITKSNFYLDDAKKFARLINTTSWMGA
ncbi:MAG: glycoside hydrolase family 9 protein, partial [candidate division KSB1 bacterium]|nr:glycoside hydrolase family 9 protein [candidate division KSB1 bacterium]